MSEQNVHVLVEALRKASERLGAAQAEHRDAEHLLAVERLRIIEAGGRDIGLPFLIGQRGWLSGERVELGLNRWGIPRLYVMTKAWKRHASRNPIAVGRRELDRFTPIEEGGAS